MQRSSLRSSVFVQTIVAVEPCFPFVLKRLQVTSRREEILNPVENAMEDIIARTTSIQVELQRQPPNSKTLQSLLQGSVRPRMRLLLELRFVD